MRLSPSKISCIFRCPRETAFKYLMNLKEAPNKNLAFGKEFHAALEGKAADLAPLQAFDSEYPWRACLTRMLAGYQEATKELPPTAAREIVHETDEIKIIVDGIRGDDCGWWIEECKTAAKVDEAKKAMLPQEIQCLAYMAHAKELAEAAWIDPSGFKGLLYTTSQKPAERRKAKENIDAFGERLTSSTVVWTYPASVFSGAEQKWATLREFALRRIDEIEAVYSKDNSVDRLPCQTASCIRYGNHCPFFSLCMGE